MNTMEKEVDVITEIKEQLNYLTNKVESYAKSIDEINKKVNKLKPVVKNIAPIVNNALDELSSALKECDKLKMNFITKTENEHICGIKSFNDGIQTKNFCITKTLSKEEKITENNITKTYGFIGYWHIFADEETGKLDYKYSEDKFLKSSSQVNG